MLRVLTDISATLPTSGYMTIMYLVLYPKEGSIAEMSVTRVLKQQPQFYNFQIYILKYSTLIRGDFYRYCVMFDTFLTSQGLGS